ncbi:MAG: hypothetical protein LBQ47_07660 [Endomicrobium sp.]|jgi:small-conductance mechanosensitive channel|nr:hypothetical protein [Endomicrobium sp.]
MKMENIEKATELKIRHIRISDDIERLTKKTVDGKYVFGEASIVFNDKLFNRVIPDSFDVEVLRDYILKNLQTLKEKIEKQIEELD